MGSDLEDGGRLDVYSCFSLGLRAGVLYADEFGDLGVSIPSLVFKLALHENSPVSALGNMAAPEPGPIDLSAGRERSKQLSWNLFVWLCGAWYIQHAMISALRGRRKIALFLLCAGTPLPPTGCSLLLSILSRFSPIFRLVVVALGYLAGALGDCSGGVSHVLLFLKNAAPSMERHILLFFSAPSRPVSRSGRAYQGM